MLLKVLTAGDHWNTKLQARLGYRIFIRYTNALLPPGIVSPTFAPGRFPRSIEGRQSDDGYTRPGSTHQGHPQVIRFHRSLPLEFGRLGPGFRHRSHCSRNGVRHGVSFTLPPTDPACSNAHQGRTPGQRDRSEHRPISIRLEPEGITPRANVKPGAALRGVPAAKEACSGTN